MLMDEHDRGDFEPLDKQATTAPATQPATDSVNPPSDSLNFMDKTAPPGQTVNSDAKKTGNKHLFISIVALIVLALIAGLIYWFSLRHKPQTKLPAKTPANSSIAPVSSATSIDATTKSYSSDNFNLALSYPADWTVSDIGGGAMSIKSPSLILTDGSGQKQQGFIIFNIRSHGQKLTEFNAGSATATRDSIKVAYTKPTSSQRANTYLSFLQYATTTTHGALDGVYVTGDNGYQKGQAIPGTDVSKADPIISITFTDTAGKAMSITDASWSDTNLSGPLTKMLQSLSIN